MIEDRFALIVASSRYEDARLRQLEAPANDADSLARVLANAAVGNFQVRTLPDQHSGKVREEIEAFFDRRKPDDLLLLYFSGHGLLDDGSRLYFATVDTKVDRPRSTAVPAEFVQELMNECLSRRQLLLLDCCNSGAFGQGAKAALEGSIGTKERFQGRGRAVITASDSLQYAFQDDKIEGMPVRSVFTRFVVEGLETGAADLDDDGLVTIDELFTYVESRMAQESARQRARKWVYDVEGQLVVAQRGTAPAPSGGSPARQGVDVAINRRIVKGLTKVANAAKVTLGPERRAVVVMTASGPRRITSGGAAVVEALEPADPFEAFGIEMAKEVVGSTVAATGDGATTALVLADSLARTSLEEIARGSNPFVLKRAVADAVAAAVEALVAQAEPVSGRDELERIVALAADDKIGAVLADAIEKVGQDGAVVIEEATTLRVELEFVEGFQFDKGYLSPYMVTDAERMEAVLEDPYILVANQKISPVKDLLPLLEQVIQAAGRPLLIVAEDVEGESLATVIVNKQRGTFTSVAVKAPGFGDRRKGMLEDIAILVGAEVIDEDLGPRLESAQLSQLGRARRVVVDRDTTTIIDGAGDPQEIIDRIRQLKQAVEKADSDFDREKLQERLGKLAGGVAVVKVGAPTETEMKEKKRHAEDALRIARAALAEGVVPGGGVAFLVARKAIEEATAPDSETVGTGIVSKALMEPARCIASNGGFDARDVLARILTEKPGVGLNAATGRFADLRTDGIVDPLLVARAALESAASVVGRFLTTETVASASST